jgi:hypothetical protein
MMSDIYRTVDLGSFSRINVEPRTVPPISKYKMVRSKFCGYDLIKYQ